MLINQSAECAVHITRSLLQAAPSITCNTLHVFLISLPFTSLTLLRIADRKRQVSGRGYALSIYISTPWRKLCSSVATCTRLFGLFKVFKKRKELGQLANPTVLDYNTHKQISCDDASIVEFAQHRVARSFRSDVFAKTKLF